MTMRTFDDTFINWYLEAAGPDVLQSVGAYKLEDVGAQLFDRINGDYFTILGLPLLPLLGFLRNKGAKRS
jgi:septum formation protein